MSPKSARQITHENSRRAQKILALLTDAEVRLFTTPGMIPHWMLTAEGRCDDRRSAQLAVEPVTAGETYEYGYLNILDTTHLVGEGVRGWVVIVQDATGTTVFDDARDSALSIMNQMGQQGWLIGDAPSVSVTNNDIPNPLKAIVIEKYGGLGVIQFYQRRYMHRRIVWRDPGGDD